MSPATIVLASGIVGIIVLDTVAASAAKWLGFKYKYSMVGSILIYLAVGYFTVRASATASPAQAAALVGVAESTVGWGIAWAMGPGKPPTMRLIKAQVVVAVLGGAAIAAAFGWLGAWAGRHWG